MKQIKTKIKIAVIAMMGMSLGINAQITELPNGNVGIGTPVPNAKLDVLGNIKLSGDIISSGIGKFTNSSDTQISLYSPDTWSGIDFKDVNGRDFIWFNGQNKTFAIGGGGANIANKKLHIEGGTSIGVGYGGNSVPLDGLAVQGNVGIGTNDPSEKLEVDGNILIGGDDQILGTTGGIRLGRKGVTTRGFTQDFSGNILAQIFWGEGVYITSSRTDPYAQEAVDVPGGDLYVTGNVGIGTTSPNPFSWGSKHLTLEATGANKYVALDLVGSGNGAGAIIFGGGSGSGTATNVARAQISAVDGSHITFNTNARDSGTSFTENMRITNAGNVGIGMISPSVALEVVGEIKVNAGNDKGFILNGNNGFLRHLGTGAKIRTNGVDALIIDNSQNTNMQGSGSTIFDFSVGRDLNVVGNVGIGTISPDEKLTVAGNIHSREVKVTINAGADFVFEKEYKLPTLESIEKFVKINKHLPGIASEKEMKKNGLLLAEMNIKLLQKIEELTLYTIAQEKMMKKLLTRIEKLESNRYEK